MSATAASNTWAAPPSPATAATAATAGIATAAGTTTAATAGCATATCTGPATIAAGNHLRAASTRGAPVPVVQFEANVTSRARRPWPDTGGRAGLDASLAR